MTLKLSDIVLVASPQHTGTWFVIRFLQRFIPRVKELTFALENITKPGMADVVYEHTYDSTMNQPTILQIHLPIVRHLNFDVNFPETRFERNWYANLGTLRCQPVQTILLFANLFKTVVPVRDPLAAILTREARQPQLRHFYIVDNFIALATEFAKHPNVFFLPIDASAHKTPKRAQLLRQMLNHCEIDAPDRERHVTEVAETWLPENGTPRNPFKAPYEVGDMPKIAEMLGPKMAEVQYLRHMASILFPFFEKLGYTRGDFIW